jgi:hypothetical protein
MKRINGWAIAADEIVNRVTMNIITEEDLKICMEELRDLKTKVPDYEACGTCGFDHAYEPTEASYEHQRQQMELEHRVTSSLGQENA